MSCRKNSYIELSMVLSMVRPVFALCERVWGRGEGGWGCACVGHGGYSLMVF